MPQPSRRRSSRIDGIVGSLLLGIVLLGAPACASMFKITPEEGAEAAKPAPKPEPKVEKPKEVKPPKVEQPKAEKPPKVETPKVEKPKEEKPKPEPKVEKPKEPEQKVAEKPAPKPEKAPEPKPDNKRPVVVAPPEIKRVEPIYEAPAVEPSPAGSDSAGVARLIRASGLWNVVRLYHPTVAQHRNEWDNTTVRLLTDVRSANTREQYYNVVREWLSRLNDDATRVISAADINDVMTASGGSGEVTSQTQIVTTGSKKTRVVDTTVVLTWPTSQWSSDTAGWNSLLQKVRDAGNATQLVIDLRAKSYASNRIVRDSALAAKELAVANLLSSRTVNGPSVRRRVYEGWPDERGNSTVGKAVWRTSDPMVVVRGQAAPRPRKIVFVADKTTELAPALLALVSNKQATLVSDAPLSDRLLVPTTVFDIGQQINATVRIGELINEDGSTGIQSDTIVAPAAPAADSAPVIRTALLIARGKVNVGGVEPGTSSRQIAGPSIVANGAWQNEHYPIMGARLLALFKMAETLRTFHAYGEMRDENLDEALWRFVPRVEAASDAYMYAATMLEFATTMNDAQGRMTSPVIENFVGVTTAPFAVRWIEGRAIVSQVTYDDAGRASTLVVGDEITAADGYPIAAYINERRKFGPASNEWSRNRNIMAMIPRGAAGQGLFKVRDAANRERTVNIARTAENVGRLTENDRVATPVSRELAARFGYLDLDRASVTDVDSAFRSLSSTRAMIIDARGRGLSTQSGMMSPAMIAALKHLASRPETVIDRQNVRIASEPCVSAEARLSIGTCVIERRQSDDVLAADTASRYKGRVVVLIDERTQGGMEQFALAASTVNETALIGSPSAGATGAVTAVNLPGQITLSFSGSDLRQPDGGQLQRIGLTPAVEVAPTVKGIRAGTDEVLARAQEWLVQQLDPAAPKRKR